MSVLSWLLDLLYPPKCVLCRKLLTGKGPVCPHCMDKLPEFDGAAPSVRFTSGGAVSFFDAQRRANVSGAYRAEQPERFAGKRVLIIDDIVTTGATLAECSRTLLQAGASDVVYAAFAAPRIQD